MHLSERAPAKVNLSLLVGSQDALGYHELFTVFVPIDVYDGLDFDIEARPPGAGPGRLRVVCSAVDGEANLVARALRALEALTGWTFDGQVVVQKRIPVGAGLGGGSADAAVALGAGARVLEEAGGQVPDRGALGALARNLGADVAFFLDPRPAIGRGIGELLESVALPRLHLVLVYLDHHLSTARVYESLDALRQPEDPSAFSLRAASAGVRWRELSDAFSSGQLDRDDAPSAIAALLWNDLEEASFELFPALVEAKRVILREGALGALMSGSGPTVFGICRDRVAAEELCARLRREGLNALVASAGGVF